MLTAGSKLLLGQWLIEALKEVDRDQVVNCLEFQQSLLFANCYLFKLSGKSDL